MAANAFDLTSENHLEVQNACGCTRHARCSIVIVLAVGLRFQHEMCLDCWTSVKRPLPSELEKQLREATSAITGR